MVIEKPKKDIIFEEEYTAVRKLLSDIIRVQRSTDIAFRGISRSLENTPKIQRVKDPNSNNSIDCSRYEYQMLNDFYRLGRPYFTVNYEILDYVACAQHYGVPTRLIDWTRDPFVALFFAVYNNSSPDNDIYTIYYAKLSEHTVIDRLYNAATWLEMESGSEFILKYKSFIDTISNKNNFKKHLQARRESVEKLGITDNCDYHENGLIFFNPPMSNDRLIAQQGLFSVPASLNNDDAANEIINKTNNFTLKIKSDIRDELLGYLINMNYTPTRLFPELESIENYISQKYVFYK